MVVEQASPTREQCDRIHSLISKTKNGFALQQIDRQTGALPSGRNIVTKPGHDKHYVSPTHCSFDADQLQRETPYYPIGCDTN
jgi:hypothetical protein